jgi:hypothetical protein
MSGVGGAIRMGELVPGNSPIVDGVKDVMRHALKFEFQGGKLNKFGPGPFWPATTEDGANEGLLLALLPSFDFNGLQTPPARSIAWTLINYGAYLVDNAGGDSFNIAAELSCDDSGNIHTAYAEFIGVWGHDFQAPSWIGPTWTAWQQDLITIVANLQAITNNGPNSIGGGGTPRQPLAPPVGP